MTGIESQIAALEGLKTKAQSQYENACVATQKMTDVVDYMTQIGSGTERIDFAGQILSFLKYQQDEQLSWLCEIEEDLSVSYEDRDGMNF